MDDRPTKSTTVPQKGGEIRKVCAMSGLIDHVGVPVIVRTVVARPNFRAVADMGTCSCPTAT